MKVHWTDTAEDHLDAIHTYIAQNSQEYAKRMVDRLIPFLNQNYNITKRTVADMPISIRGNGMTAYAISEYLK